MTNANTPHELMTRDEAMFYLRCGKTSLWQIVRRERWSNYGSPRAVRYQRSEVEAYRKRQALAPAPWNA